MAQDLLSGQIAVQTGGNGFVQISVDNEQSHRLCVNGQRGGYIQIRHGFRNAAGVAGTLETDRKGSASAVLRGIKEGVIDGLGPGAASGFRHNGGQGIDQLGKTGDLNGVGIVDERVEYAPVSEILDEIEQLEGEITASLKELRGIL